MSDELDWNFVDKDDAKAEIRAAVEYLLRGTSFATWRTDNHPSSLIPSTMVCRADERPQGRRRHGWKL